MSRYGNLYLDEDAFPGCETAEVIRDVNHAAVTGRFMIGPTAHDEGPCELDFDRSSSKILTFS